MSQYSKCYQCNGQTTGIKGSPHYDRFKCLDCGAVFDETGTVPEMVECSFETDAMYVGYKIELGRKVPLVFVVKWRTRGSLVIQGCWKDTIQETATALKDGEAEYVIIDGIKIWACSGVS